MTKKSFSWIDFIPVTFASILFISQIIVGIYLLSDISQIEILAYVGVGLYVFSGIVFGMLPVAEFRKRGGVERRRSRFALLRRGYTRLCLYLPLYTRPRDRQTHTKPPLQKDKNKPKQQ